MSTLHLTWPEARELVLKGVPVRREGWPDTAISEIALPIWLERRPGLWVLTDSAHSELRVVDAAWFASAEFFGSDWTTDAPGAERDVCARPPLTRNGREFVPPGIGLTGSLAIGTLTLAADVGQMSPAGVCWLEFLVNGVVVGGAEAATAGRSSVSLPVSDVAGWSAGAALTISAMLRVRTSLPLPAWEGLARWGTTIPAPVEMLSIDLGELFPNDYDYHPAGWLGAWVTCGPYSEPRWLYSHADNPAAFDDDMGLDGVVVYPDGYADYVNGGATTLLKYLPAGSTFTLNVWNSGGWCSAGGELRLYSHEL